MYITNSNKVYNFLFFSSVSTLLFVFHRFYYFLIGKIEVLRISSDATWWWLIQNWYVRFGEGFHKTEVQSLLEFRLKLEIFLQQLISKASMAYDVPLLELNLLITSFIYLALCSILYLTGKAFFKSRNWALIFMTLVMLTNYSTFIKYPIFTPKSLGFLTFPIFYLIGFQLFSKPKFNILYLIVLLTSVNLYIPSVTYYLFPIIAASLLNFLFFKFKNPQFYQMFFSLLIFWITFILASYMFILYQKGGSTILTAPPIEITELIYKNHNFEWPYIRPIIARIIPGLLLISIGYWCIKKSPKFIKFEQQIFIYSFCVFFGLSILSLSGLYFANKIEFIRISWVWRCIYFSPFPAIVCLLIGIKSRSRNINNPFLFYGVILTFLALIFLSFPYFVNKRHSFKYSNYIKHESVYEKNEAFKKLIQFTQNLKEPKKLLLPKISDQNIDTDILQVESFTPVELSRSNRPHLIYMTNKSIDFASDISRLNNAYSALTNENDWKPLINLALNKGCAYILINDQELINEISDLSQGQLKAVFKNEYWLVLQINF